MLVLIRFILINLLSIFEVILLIYCICSWVIQNPYNKFYGILCKICDPVLNPIRSVLQRISFLQSIPIDFSPYLLIVLLRFFLRFI